MGTSRADCRRIDEEAREQCDNATTAARWGPLNVYESWRSEKRTVKRTTLICDHIDKWSKRNLWSGTGETQWDVLTTSKQTRFPVVILEQSFLFLTRPDARQYSFWSMSCIFVCHSHLTSITILTAVWAQACGLEHKAPMSLSCIFGPFASTIFFCLCWCVGGSSVTILPLLVQMLRTVATVTILVGELAIVSRYCYFCTRF